MSATKTNHSSYEANNAWLNSIVMLGVTAASVLLAPFSFLLILFLAPAGGWMIHFGPHDWDRGLGRSLLIGCLLGFVYLGAVASQVP